MSLASLAIGSSATTILTSANAGGTAVVTIAIFNSDTVARVVSVHATIADAATSSVNKLFDISIAAGESYIFDSKILLADTDRIKMLCPTASVTYATISYLNL